MRMMPPRAKMLMIVVFIIWGIGCYLLVVVVFFSTVVVFPDGLTLISTFFSSLAGGLMIVVFFSVTFSGVGETTRLSQPMSTAVKAARMICFFMLGKGLRMFCAG